MGSNNKNNRKNLVKNRGIIGPISKTIILQISASPELIEEKNVIILRHHIGCFAWPSAASNKI